MSLVAGRDAYENCVWRSYQQLPRCKAVRVVQCVSNFGEPREISVGIW